jgi:hypothetical protein
MGYPMIALSGRSNLAGRPLKVWNGNMFFYIYFSFGYQKVDIEIK